MLRELKRKLFDYCGPQILSQKIAFWLDLVEQGSIKHQTLSTKASEPPS